MERHIEDPGDFLRDYEDMDEGEAPSVTVADEAQADRHLKAVRYLRAEREKVQAHADQEAAIVENWRQREFAKIDRRLAWHEGGLTGFLSNLGKSSWKGVWGSIRKYAGRESVEVTHVGIFAAWAKVNAPNLLRVKVEPDKAAVKAFIKDGGELPPGVELATGADSYKVEVTGGN